MQRDKTEEGRSALREYCGSVALWGVRLLRRFSELFESSTIQNTGLV